MKLAFLFAGQGSQKVGMGVSLAASCDDCRATFELADKALDFPLTKIMAEGPEEELRRTAIAQPALLTLAVMHARHLSSMGFVPDALAGHSLGQYAALVIAGSLEFTNAIRLVAARGQLMQQTVPESEGAMMAIVALDREVVYTACDTARSVGVVNVACHNTVGQTVISGEVAAVEAAAQYCEEEGGGAVPLAVSAPFHCALLSPMVSTFTDLVEAVGITHPEIPVIDNVTAEPLIDSAAVRHSLIAQLTAPVLFEESLHYLVREGVQHFIQCGPGKSLLGFAKRVIPSGQFNTFKQAQTALLSEG